MRSPATPAVIPFPGQAVEPRARRRAWRLVARPANTGASSLASRVSTLPVMPSFDVVSEVDRQEVRNAVDQARREINTRFDFKNTNSEIDQTELTFTLRTVSDDRLAALRQVFEEKLVKRGVSLKGLDYGKVEEATQNTVRQVATLKVGISSDKGGRSTSWSRTRRRKASPARPKATLCGSKARRKRDDLQAAIAAIKAADLGIPVQFQNFRD